MSYDVVNGYICRNCSDVDYAKRHIDPAHPHDGPFGVSKDKGAGHGPAVVLGGSLAKPDPSRPPGGVNAVAAVTPATGASAAAQAAADRPRALDLRI